MPEAELPTGTEPLACLVAILRTRLHNPRQGTYYGAMTRIRLAAAAAAIFALSGCATGMRMTSLPSPGDTTRIGNVNVKVVDLDGSRAAAFAPKVRPIPKELLAAPDSSYRIGPFDVLVVTVWEHPELSQPLGQYRNDIAAGQLVDADGTMYFPYAGRIQVKGLSPIQIQAMIAKSLSKVLRDPQVDVKVSAYRSQRVQVSGEVRNPNSYAIEDVPMTLVTAINRSGGLTPTADAAAVRLIRNGKVYELDYENLSRMGAPLDSIRMRNGDQIYVPNTEDRVAYVLGEVARPTMLRLTNGKTTLVRGLTEAGGFDALNVDAAGVYVVRAEDSANVTVFRLDGRSPVALAYAGQFQLHPKDLIYVDQSGLSRWSRVFQMLVPMSTVLSGTTGVLSNTTGSALNLQNIKETWVGN